MTPSVTPLATQLSSLAVLAARARRARSEGGVLLGAVLAGNVAYAVAAATRGPSSLAWAGVIAASVIAHLVAWRSRRFARAVDDEIRAQLSRLRVQS